MDRSAVAGAIDVFDRGARFKANRYALRLHSRDRRRVIVCDSFESRTTAEYAATLLVDMIASWVES